MVQETAIRVNEGIVGNLIVRIGKRLYPRPSRVPLSYPPSGKQVVLGTPGEGFSADLTLRNFKVIWASVRRAQLAFSKATWRVTSRAGIPQNFSSST